MNTYNIHTCYMLFCLKDFLKNLFIQMKLS
ncbi:unnamed protein product [Callosobruchus maculatus]|uniref:Uncharacterized protein n=1 Tax=Callosobruchus maculatus TaxID=64391 RepID=A0A653C4I1_CALMS|nr:unnamed protein product [Callosobruchus maculatus]